MSAVEINTNVEYGQKTEVDLSLVPEHLRPREYGKKETAPIPISKIIRVSQQRGVSNPAFGSIKASLDNGDMINQPDVGVVSRESLEAYFDFINRLWGANHSVDDYEPDSFGNYYLAEAGHTRIDAAEALETKRLKDAIEEGYDVTDWPEATVWVKLHRDQEPEDILRLQLDENLHEKPSQERTAIAMVETYFYGLEQGKWSTKDEFVEANKKFSRNALDAALAFCELDEVIRSFVFTGAVSYGPVVELGKGVALHREYLAKRFFGAECFDELESNYQMEVEEQVQQWNASEIAFIQNKKLNVTAAKARHLSFREEWKGFEMGSDVQDKLFVDPTREWRDQRANTRKELRERVSEIAKLPSSSALRALQLHVEIMQPDTQEGFQMLQQLESGIAGFRRKFEEVVEGAGSVALFAAIS